MIELKDRLLSKLSFPTTEQTHWMTGSMCHVGWVEVRIGSYRVANQIGSSSQAARWCVGSSDAQVIHTHCPGLAPSGFVESFSLIQVNELPFCILLPGHYGSRSGHSHAQKKMAGFDTVADGQQEQAEGGFHSQSREL